MMVPLGNKLVSEKGVEKRDNGWQKGLTAGKIIDLYLNSSGLKE